MTGYSVLAIAATLVSTILLLQTVPGVNAAVMGSLAMPATAKAGVSFQISLTLIGFSDNTGDVFVSISEAHTAVTTVVGGVMQPDGTIKVAVGSTPGFNVRTLLAGSLRVTFEKYININGETIEAGDLAGGIIVVSPGKHTDIQFI